MGVETRYPDGPVTPHGVAQIMYGDVPDLILKSYDGTSEIYLSGGMSIPDPTRPECVLVPRDGLRGLIPPWEHIEYKGATDDGVTHDDALYGPIDVQLTAVCCGRDLKHTRRVARDLIAAVDAKQQAELGFLDQENGYWWAPVRWHRGGMPNPATIHTTRQAIPLRLQADDGFWRTYDVTDAFTFGYHDLVEEFDEPTESGAGDNWPINYYEGTGGGFVRVRNGQLYWVDDPDDWWFTLSRKVALGPFRDFETAGDNQVASIVFGSFQEIAPISTAENHIWLRMGRNQDGTWNGDGVVAMIGAYWAGLYRYKSFVPTIMATTLLWWPPMPGEEWTFIAGDDERGPRFFQILRGGGRFPVLQHLERGEGSEVGANHRGVGLGMRAVAAIMTQVTPASIRRFTAGDNAKVSQEGFVSLVNVGDQPMYPDFFLFGPGKFKIADGPGSSSFVEFGPLRAGQVAMLRTDPRDRNVYDASVAEPQADPSGNSKLARFLDFGRGANDVRLAKQLRSLFDKTPPQGPFYALLNGRFSDASAIPPKPAGADPVPYSVKVSIEDGSADSRIVVSGTPRRRYPL